MRDRVMQPGQGGPASARRPVAGERAEPPIVRAAMDLQKRAGNRSVAELVGRPPGAPDQHPLAALSIAGGRSGSADAGGGAVAPKGRAESATERRAKPSAERSSPPLEAILLPGIAALHANAMQRMQGTPGNRAGVGITVQRDPPTPTNIAGPAPAPVPADLQAFRDRGPMPAAAVGQLIQPTPGGGFQARYDPVAMNLTVTMNVGMTFVDGMSMSGNRAVAGHASLNAAATQINALPRAERAAAVARWQWAGDQETWMTGYKANVTGAWNSAGSGLQFQSSHPGWEAQLARVNIVVNTQNVTVAGPLPAGASTIPVGGRTHCNATIYKTPDDNTDFGARGGGRDAAGQSLLELGSGQTVAHSHLLRQRVFFDRGSVTLNAAAQSQLQNIIYSFQTPTGGTGTRIDITGHADTVGASTAAGELRNQQISQQRAQAVAAYLGATRVGGNNLANAAARIKTTTGTGSTGESRAATSRRVDIVMAGGAGQNTAAHEFGHMLGLQDEYASDPTRTQGVVFGTGQPVGTVHPQDARSTAAGLGNSVYENNDNLMSLGSTIRSPQYVTFMEALRTVTGSNEWRLKA
jgi:outer membrane protein OmpA-like peptidoglycan-associated protein